ncbi:hypothetical protein L873DRAFT_202349 [Choiromyces venosus 120613-1]|uniref:Uncharacterized protein n=1 Tax=Choiromyces venosus 120613-1 TaxID=1336337 RepID=A0A3N4J4V0_9PEZI|nr:hypothetical protein L873DRAFT_202349 [Choiromyces venosus 120613-1]
MIKGEPWLWLARSGFQEAVMADSSLSLQQANYFELDRNNGRERKGISCMLDLSNSFRGLECYAGSCLATISGSSANKEIFVPHFAPHKGSSSLFLAEDKNVLTSFIRALPLVASKLEQSETMTYILIVPPFSAFHYICHFFNVSPSPPSAHPCSGVLPGLTPDRSSYSILPTASLIPVLQPERS